MTNWARLGWATGATSWHVKNQGRSPGLANGRDGRTVRYNGVRNTIVFSEGVWGLGEVETLSTTMMAMIQTLGYTGPFPAFEGVTNYHNPNR